MPEEPYRQTIREVYEQLFPGQPVPEKPDSAIWLIFRSQRVGELPAALKQDLLEIALEGPIQYTQVDMQKSVIRAARGLWPGLYPSAVGP